MLTALCNVGYGHPLLVGHEPQEGEYDDTGEHGGTAVDRTDQHRVLNNHKPSINQLINLNFLSKKYHLLYSI